MSAAEQIEQLKALLPNFSFSVTLGRLLSPLQSSDLVKIFAILSAEKDARAIMSWLGYVGAVGFKELPPEANVLLELAAHPEEKVRSEALEIILNAKDEQLGKAFADSGWKYQGGQTSAEAIQGTYLVARWGTHLAFADVNARILPQARAYAVEARGCKDEEVRMLADQVHELLDEYICGSKKTRSAYPYSFPAENAWKKVAALDEAAIIEKMHKVASRHGMLGMFSIFPLTELVEAILAVRPDDGAKIWLAARNAQRSVSVTIGDFDSLIFEKSEHEEIVKLRKHAVQTATNDAQLAEIAHHALRNGQEEWLITFIREDLAASTAGQVARGITLAGFLDSSRDAETLWEHDIDPRPLPDWLMNVRAASKETYNVNKRARHWFDRFFSTNDHDQAFGYLELFTLCADARAPIWVGEVARGRRQKVPPAWLHHYAVLAEQRKKRRKEFEDQRKKTLYFTTIAGSLSPWL